MFLVKFLEIWLLLETGDYSDGGTCLKLLCAPPPFCWGRGGGGWLDFQPNFQKRESLVGPQHSEGVCWEREG